MKTLERAHIEQFYKDLERPLYNLALRWVWNSEEAMEIVQDTFVSLWNHRSKVRVDGAKSYAFRICVNKAKNKIRARKVRSLFQFSDPGSFEMDPVFEKNQEERILFEKINQLPEKLKSVILLSDLSELSYNEISDILKIPIGTVGSRRNEALKKLKLELGSIFEEKS